MTLRLVDDDFSADESDEPIDELDLLCPGYAKDEHTRFEAEVAKMFQMRYSTFIRGCVKEAIRLAKVRPGYETRDPHEALFLAWLLQRRLADKLGWPPADDEMSEEDRNARILDLWNKGFTARKISGVMGTSEKTVREYLKKVGKIVPAHFTKKEKA